MDKLNVIGTVEKSALEAVKVGVSTFKGKTYVDIRVWYTEEGKQESIPTKKGICLHPEIMTEVLPLLKRAVAVAQGDDEDAASAEPAPMQA